MTRCPQYGQVNAHNRRRDFAGGEKPAFSMLHLDFETRSLVELRGQKSVGLWNYANHPSTSVLMLGWAIDNEPAQVWEPRNGPMPSELEDRLRDPSVELAAFNSTFERYIAKFKLGVDTAIERYQDPQASARYLSLPGDLEDVSTILGLPDDLAKDKEGKRLIDLFSKSHKKRKKKGEEAEEYFPDWTTHPEEWAKFVEYCRRDVVTEREVMRRLKLLEVFPLPLLERKIWVFDQKVNDRGIPTPENFVRKALKLAEREKQEAIEAQNKLTGLENANSNSQMLAWVKTQGFEGNSLRKGAVDAALKYNQNLTPLCCQVLEARKAASSTAYKKLAAILRQVSSDGKLRNQFIYGGSSRCLRWSGNGVQLHNFARPNKTFEVKENVEKARALILAEDYEGIKREFGSVLLVVKYNIRGVFTANQGDRFNVCDLNAIETRVGAWMSQCGPLLEVFKQGRDPYLDFATKMTGIPYEQLDRDVHSRDEAVKAKAKEFRQIAKPGVLGCVYRLSGGQMGRDKNGDPVKQGLWGYAEAMGVNMTQEQAHEVVKVFRESYPEIKRMWFDFEEAVKDVLNGKQTKRELGPRGCIKIDKFVFTCNGNERTILRIQLPSGRRLHYLDAFVDDVKMPWQKDGEDVYKATLCYSGQDQTTKQWKDDITSHGGKLTENVDQGIARDVLATKMLDLDQIMPIVLHVHDEAVGMTEDDIFAPGLPEMIQIMNKPVDWAPDLPLGSDGFMDNFYHK